MSMQVWTSSYALQPVASLSAKVSKLSAREGALLRIETAGGVGYADVHPWVELGDLPLAQQLESLTSAYPTKLISRSLALASLDRVARAARVSAFDGLAIPESHYLINDLSIVTEPGFFAQIAMLGFRTLKLKLGRNLPDELYWISRWSFELTQFVLRFDFNGGLSPDSYRAFVEALPDQVRAVVEFVEDPVPWNFEVWGSLGGELKLALDRSDDTDVSGWRIWKPAVQDASVLASASNVCVTSYLDHPVGQMGAALEAALLIRPVGTCGLVSQIAYESNAFSEALGDVKPVLGVPEGTGIGFDSLLESLPWKKLE